MAILCGVDDSAPALQAARAAAALAQRAGEDLELVHVQELYWPSVAAIPDAPVGISVSQELLEAERRRAKAVLEPLRDALAREFGVRVGLRFESGFPDWELSRCAQQLDASLIVVGAIGRRSGSMWRLGGVPDRLSQSAPVPVLVVRASHGLSRWALEGHPLKIVVALGTERSSARAMDLAAGLARLGPCEIVAAHAYDPWREARRLGFGSADDPGTRLLLERALARDVPERSGSAAALGQARFVPLPCQGHVAEALSEFVEKERADMVLLGTRDRGALERRFLGSVAYGLLGLAEVNVLVAREREPAGGAARRGPRTPASVRRLLAATDFSEAGNRAVDYALGLLPKGGQLTLLHVLAKPALGTLVPVPDPLDPGPEGRRMDRTLAQAELRRLLPGPEGGREVEVEAVEAADVPAAILQAAERHDADLLVLGRSGQGLLATAFIGSCARAVARNSPRPVLLVPTDERG